MSSTYSFVGSTFLLVITADLISERAGLTSPATRLFDTNWTKPLPSYTETLNTYTTRLHYIARAVSASHNSPLVQAA